MNATIVRKMFRSTLTIQILTALTAVLGTVVDGIVTAGCLGTNAMAAYGIAVPITTIFTGISGVFGTGISVLSGRTIGAGDKKETNRIFSICMTVSILCSILMILVTYLGAGAIASALGAGGDQYSEVVDYLRGFSISAPGIVLVIELMPIMQIDSDRNRALYAIGMATAVNIAGDLLNGFILHKGLFVMALATTVSYYVGAAILLLHFVRKETLFRFSFVPLDPKVVGGMFSYGIPNAMQQVCRSILTICVNHIILFVSDANGVAAYSAVFTLSMMCMAVGTGVSQSTSIITGVFAGEKDLESIRMLLKEAFKTTAVLNAALMTAVVIASPVLIRCYFHGDPAVYALAVTGLRFYAFCLVFYGLNVALRSYYQAMHLVQYAYPYVLLDNLVCVAVSAFCLGRLMGMNGVWLSFLVGEVLTLFIFLILAFLDRDNADLLSKIMHIRPEFTNGIEAIRTWSGKSERDIEDISTKVLAFCLEKGGDSRLSYLLALATEEMGINIIRYGFVDEKKHSVDVKAIRQTAGWMLRIRDDCALFDPVRYMEGYDDPAPESHIGIRMVARMSKRMEYISTLKINNLLIEIE